MSKEQSHNPTSKKGSPSTYTLPCGRTWFNKHVREIPNRRLSSWFSKKLEIFGPNPQSSVQDIDPDAYFIKHNEH